MKDLILMKLLSTATLLFRRRPALAGVAPLDLQQVLLPGAAVQFRWPAPLRKRNAGPAKQLKSQLPDEAPDALPGANGLLDTRIMQNCPDIVCTVDTEGRFVHVNQACYRIWGYRTDEVEGHLFTDFILPADIRKTSEAALQLINGSGVTGFENSYLHKDGRIVPMLWSVRWAQEEGLIYAVGRDATTIKSAEAALQEGEQKYRSLFDYNPDAVFSLDLNGRFMSANEKVTEMTGCPVAEVKGLPFWSFVPAEQLALATGFFQRAQKGERMSYDISILNKNGKTRIVNMVHMPMIVKGRITGIYGIARDITDKKQTESELQKLNESLELKIKERTSQMEQSNKELEAFSYSVSHDLRAPLRIINGYSKLLSNELGENIDGDSKEFLTAIIDNTIYMGRLIDDLLNLSRLGREAVHPSETDMTTLVNVVLQEMRMQDPGINAEICIKPLSTCTCDQRLIRQVWANLIANAIKYSRKKKQPRIEIGSYDKGDSSVYYIKDNGAGFDMKFAAKLFGVFIRLHDRSEFDGTGVGLALVHRIVSKHNGKVWANGKVDEGAVFYFSLPKTEPACEAEQGGWPEN